MMELIKPGTKINFTGKIKVFAIISIAAVVISLGALMAKGFNWGIDFAGGTVIQVKFTNAVSLEDVRETVAPVVQGEFMLQNFGEPNEVLIRILNVEGVGLQELSDNIKDKLSQNFEGTKIQRIEQVGPQVGDELRKKAIYAVLFSTIGILVYIALRFELFFAIGAIVSLLHDIIVMLGIYCLSGKEFNLTVMAALMTAAGYSLNDTIVIFDRIREKLKNGKLAEVGWKEVINSSLNETLSRTILTSVLTLVAAVALFIFGGEVINGFALLLIVGVIVGTYSSIAVAAMFIYHFSTHNKPSK